MKERILVTLHSQQRFRRMRDYVVAQMLWRTPAALRHRLFFGAAHYCPICESHLRRFLRLHRDYHLWCPVCRSLQRHRLVWKFLEQQPVVLQPGAKLLHIAPEPSLEATFTTILGLQAISADRYEPDVDVTLDIEALPFGGASFGLLFCSHVLEHVPDDRQALHEFRRVLPVGGKALLLVPITVERTIEEPTLDDPVLREELFGQHDHVRRYGRDFMDRCVEAGFDCTMLVTDEIVEPWEIDYLGLNVGEEIFVCEAR